MNTLIDEAISSEDLNGKKYTALGKEALSFTDIDNLIKQIYCPNSKFQDANKNLKSLVEGLTLFFHGNNHIINFSKMIKYLQAVDPLNENYTNLIGTDNLEEVRSFREYYSSKRDTSDTNSINVLIEDEKENLNYPNYRDYWSNSLH